MREKKGREAKSDTKYKQTQTHTHILTLFLSPVFKKKKKNELLSIHSGEQANKRVLNKLMLSLFEPKINWSKVQPMPFSF